MQRLRRELETCFAALGFFTRIPVPAWVGYSGAGLAQAARYLPAIGLLLGTMAALVCAVARLFWPLPVAVLLAMATTLYATGAFHEDGLSDTSDGLGGGWEKSRILEIMKDSRVGSYGVVALVMALLGKFVLLSALGERHCWLLLAALPAGHAVSRFCAVSLMRYLDYVREDSPGAPGVPSKSRPVAHRLSRRSLWLAGGFALVGLVAIALLAPATLPAALLLSALATLWLRRLFLRWLGGYTGDCLGAVQQVTELAFYLGLLLRWPVAPF